jgi:hypothetical protein
MTPLPHFPVLTPLGPAVCVGILAEQDDVEWVTFILATGEPCFWRNPHIRLRRNVTNGLMQSSPFSHLNEAVLAQIERYKHNGWLPAQYSPGDPETWRL